MVVRTISGAVLVVLFLALIIPGGDILLCGMGIVSAIGLYELYKVFKIEKSFPALMGYLALVTYYVNLKYSFIPDMMMFVVLFLLITFASYVITFPKYKPEQILAVFVGVFYVGVMLSYVYQIRVSNNGIYLVWLIFLCSWICDTFAYLVGVTMGKHKMTPVLSPKKSWEGAVGGIAGTVICTYIYCTVCKDYMGIENGTVIILTIISIAAAIFSMFGDLAASAIKRHYDIKDYGKLIPGHGGIMDRFDSIIFTAPIIYYLCTYFI